MIKLIALDLDGTTLNAEHTLSRENREVLLEAQRRGIIVTLATGRMFRSALPFAEELQIEAPLVVYNGALTVMPQDGRIISDLPLELSAARRLTAIGKKHKVQLQVYMNDTLVVEHINHKIAAYSRICRVPALAVGDMAAYMQSAPTKVLFIAPQEILAPIWEEVKAEFGTGIYITKSAPDYLEMINPAANKGAGLRSVARHYGINKEEILVCGDSLNDMELFAAAGVKVAMANAIAELKAEADYITAANYENGVAQAVRHFCF